MASFSDMFGQGGANQNLSSFNIGGAPSASSGYVTNVARAKAPAPGGLKGFLINNLPAIGGGLGGIAGLFVPGADATGVSEIGGAALGSGLGEQLKQNLLGTNQGNIGEQLKQDVIQSGEAAALGGLGKGLGMARGGAKGVLGVGEAKAADNLATQAAKPNVGGNLLQRLTGGAAAEQGMRQTAAQNALVDQGFSGVPKNVMQGSTTTIGEPFGYQNVKAMVSRLGLPSATSDQLAGSMQKLSDANNIIGNHLTTALENVGNVQAPNIEQAMTTAVNKQIGKLGSIDSGGAATDTLNHMRGILQNVVYGGQGHVGNSVNAANVMDGIRALEQAAKNAGTSDTASGQRAAYNYFKAALSDVLNQPRVSQAISGYKIPAAQAESLSAEFGPKLADYITNAVNKGASVQDVRSTMQPGIVAGDIASAYGKAQQGGLEKAAGGSSAFSNGELPTVFEAAGALHGNPVAMAALASRATGGNIIGKTAAKLNPAAAESGANAAKNASETTLLQSNPAAAEALGVQAASGATPTLGQNALRAATTTPTGTAGAIENIPSALRNSPLGPLARGVSAADQGVGNVVRVGGDLARGAGGFGVRMAAAPIGRPLATSGAVAKQYLGRAGANAVLNGIGPTLSNLGNAGSDTAQGQTAQQNQAPDMTGGLNTTDTSSTGGTSTLGGGAGTNAANQGGESSIYGQDNLAYDLQRDPAHASTYLELYKTLNPSGGSSSATTIKPTAQQYGEAQSGLGSLQQLADMIQKNPNIVNQTAIPGQEAPLIGGLVRNAVGTGDYQAAAQNTLDALARARTGAAMSKSEESFYKRMLPQAGDSADTVQFKLQQLQSAFAPFLQANNAGGQ